MFVLVLGHKPLPIEAKFREVANDRLALADEAQSHRPDLGMLLDCLLHLSLAPSFGAQVELVFLDVLDEVGLIAEAHVVILRCRVLLAQLQFWGVRVLRVGVGLLLDGASPKLCNTAHSDLLVAVFLVLTIGFDLFHSPSPPEPCPLRLCSTLPGLDWVHILDHV